MDKDDLMKKINGLGFATELALSQGDIDQRLGNDVKNTLDSVKRYLRKEKKYIVDIEGCLILAKHGEDGFVEPYGETILHNDDYIKELTEKEIRGYDERFLLFAEEVEW